MRCNSPSNVNDVSSTVTGFARTLENTAQTIPRCVSVHCFRSFQDAGEEDPGGQTRPAAGVSPAAAAGGGTADGGGWHTVQTGLQRPGLHGRRAYADGAGRLGDAVCHPLPPPDPLPLHPDHRPLLSAAVCGA